MPILNPTQLVDELKKSGEFDRLRRELLAQFQRNDAMAPFMARVEDVARQRITSDPKLLSMPQETIHRELMQEMDRYPIVERAVADVAMLSDPAFAQGIQVSARRILRTDRGEKSPVRVTMPQPDLETSIPASGHIPRSSPSSGGPQELKPEPSSLDSSSQGAGLYGLPQAALSQQVTVPTTSEVPSSPAPNRPHPSEVDNTGTKIVNDTGAMYVDDVHKGDAGDTSLQNEKLDGSEQQLDQS